MKLGEQIHSKRTAACSFLTYRPPQVLLAFAISLVVLRCETSEIPIANHSFEMPALSEGAYVSPAPGWSGSGGLGRFGTANPPSSWFSRTDDLGPGPSPIDGLNIAFSSTGAKMSFEDTNLVVQPSTAYTLTLLVGHRIGVPFGRGSISFWAGTTMLAEILPDPPEDQFIATSLIYTSPPSGTVIGQPLRIELTTIGTDAQAWFDNLRLFAEPVPPSVCTPHKALATAQLVNGVFVGARIDDSGCGYTNPPAVLIQGGGGTGATARAFISDGRVTEIRVTNGGCCYTNTPRVVIGSPPFVPTVAIRVSRINVTQNVVLGWKYILETSADLVQWTATGPAFVADSESISTEFNADMVGRYFRLTVVP